MAKYADLLLRQYLGPALGDNAPLALYCLTQLTAISACFALRELPPVQPPAPSPGPTTPARSQVSGAPPTTAPAPAYERGMTEAELKHIPSS